MESAVIATYRVARDLARGEYYATTLRVPGEWTRGPAALRKDSMAKGWGRSEITEGL
jgi:hypothetical protein